MDHPFGSVNKEQIDSNNFDIVNITQDSFNISKQIHHFY